MTVCLKVGLLLQPGDENVRLHGEEAVVVYQQLLTSNRREKEMLSLEATEILSFLLTP